MTFGIKIIMWEIDTRDMTLFVQTHCSSRSILIFFLF